jgi:hypothetical protein
LFTCQIGRHQTETRNVGTHDTLDFDLIRSQVPIFREYHPTFLADWNEPFYILRVLTKVFVMSFDALTGCAERVRHDKPSEAAV